MDVKRNWSIAPLRDEINSSRDEVPAIAQGEERHRRMLLGYDILEEISCRVSIDSLKSF